MNASIPGDGKISISLDVELHATAAVNAAFEVPQSLFENSTSAGEAAFCCELEMRGVRHRRQIPVPVQDTGRFLEVGFRADGVLDETPLIDLKAVEGLQPVHKAPVMTGLNVLNPPLGLLFDPNVVRNKAGTHRIMNRRHRLS